MKDDNLNKKIDKSRYSVVDIKNISKEEMEEQGCVFMPYLCVEHTEESSSEYDKFMKEYNRLHACCPKCGETSYITTLVGYVLNMEKKEEYKDLNSCTCSECGDNHTQHDRVPQT